MFEHLKTRADRLAGDAGRLRRERNEHARRGYEILRHRAGSPLGLTVCFGAGVFAGARSRRPDAPGNGNDRGKRPAPEHREEAFAHRLLHGPVGAAAIKLGTAFIAGRLMQPDDSPPPPSL